MRSDAMNNPKIYLLMLLIGVLMAAVNLFGRSKAGSGRRNASQDGTQRLRADT
jgi:hypothetical protein